MKIKRKKEIPLSVPVIKGNEWKYVKDCLDSGWVSSAGDYVPKFERAIARLTGARYAVACINGTAALHIALILSKVGPGDEVLVPTLTFIAPVNAVKYVGAEPVFMDCDEYLNLDVDKTREFLKQECKYKNRRLINKRTGRRIAAILPVHIFGHPVDLDPLLDLARRYNLKVIEDATESLGSYYISGRIKGRFTGAVGELGCLSFNGNKIITAGGGGMLITNDPGLAKRARYLTTQAKDDELRYIHNEIGYNYRLNNIQAAFGLAQTERIGEYIRIKRANFNIYNRALSRVCGLRMIEEPPYSFSNYWFYSLVVEGTGRNNCERLRTTLQREGIPSRLLWLPNHLQKPYRKQPAYRIEKAGNYLKKVLNLPCSVNLKKTEIERIIKVIAKHV